MRILAIETSGRDATLAALEGSESDGDKGETHLVREVAVIGPERTAQFLAPRLKELLVAVGWQPSQIELVAVAVGPGSFTGLRIGVTTAKTLAYAVGAQVVGVNTLATIAQQAPAKDAPLWCVMDAQRQELFAAKIDETGSVTSETQILSQPAWLKMLKPGDRVSGPGLRQLRVTLPSDVHVVEQLHWQPLATTVGLIGWREFHAGRRDDLWKLAPQYYRQSAAEEKRDLSSR